MVGSNLYFAVLVAWPFSQGFYEAWNAAKKMQKAKKCLEINSFPSRKEKENVALSGWV
jgi:hypothetical protein